MEILRQLWRDAQTVLRDMSTTQRVTVTALILIIASLLTFAAWMGSSSTETGRIPLPLAVEPGDSNEMLARLRDKGIGSAEYDFDSKRILVNTDEEKKAVIALAEDNLLKDAHTFGFDAMLERWSFSDTRLKSEESMRLARANEVARLIEALNPVSEAQVIYSDDAKHSLFGVAHKKSASVRVKTKLQKPLNEEAANTIIALVAAAKAGLDERDIVVSDQMGNKFHSSSTNSLSSVARQKWDHEFALNEALRRKLENLMRQYIPNIQYEGDVNAFPKHDVAFNTEEILHHEVLPGEVSANRSEKISLRSSSRPHEEPGVNPNVRRSANLGGEFGWYVTETSEDRKSSERTNQNSWRQTATKVAPKVSNLTVSAIIHLPYRLKRDDGGELIQSLDASGEPLFDTETGAPVWERESVEPIPADRVEELKRQIAHASGIRLDEIPEKIEVSQIPWMAPVHLPRGGGTAWGWIKRWLDENGSNLMAFAFFGLVVFAIVLIFFFRPIPTEVDDTLDEDTMSLAMTSDMEDEDPVDDEWESLRAKVAAVVQEDPKRAAGLLKRWMRKD